MFGFFFGQCLGFSKLKLMIKKCQSGKLTHYFMVL